MSEYIIMHDAKGAYAPCARETAVGEKRALEQYILKTDERNWSTGRDNDRFCLIDSVGHKYVAVAAAR